MNRSKASWLALFMLAVLVAAAEASPSKLDPRARVALARLRGGSTIEQMRAAGTAIDAAGNLDVFIVGPVSRAELEALGVTVRTSLPGLCTAYIPDNAVERVAALAGVSAIRGSAPVERELDLSVPTTGANLARGAGPAFTGINGAGVLVGDVDTGVDFDHGDFKDAGGLTRLVNIWDQTGGGPPPGGFGYGTEWTAAQINGGLCTETDTDGHGTHVLGIAGGDGSQTGGAIPAHTFVGMAPMADLIMVKTNFQTTDVFDGVSYIFNRATALGKNAAVNLSLGSHFGSHDGTSAFEAGLSALTGPGRIICKSAGNERGQARHAEVFAAGAGTNVTLSVSGAAGAGRTIAIDGYYESTENLSVRITTPNGTVIGPVALGGVNAAYPGTSAGTNGLVYLENGVALSGGGDPEVYIELDTTLGTDTQNGTWTFTFIPVALGAANGEVDLWRFFTSTGVTANFVTGNQATEELISEPGNAVELITTAAWVSKRTWTACTGTVTTFTGTPAPGPLASFSSPGPTRDGRQKPDIAAPGLAVISTRSFDVPGLACPVSGPSTLVNDGSNHIANAGTSMAAPHSTGASALLMQKYGAMTPAQIKSYLSAHATIDGFTGAPWNKDWGNGKLNIGDLVNPVVTVVSPNGGDTLNHCTVAKLSWTATDAGTGVTVIDIQLSRSGSGGPFEDIAIGTANAGTYSWTVTGPATANAFLKVTAHDGNGNQASDLSDTAFTITTNANPTTITLASDSTKVTVGSKVTLTASVVPPAASGTVNFFDGAVPIGSAPLAGGTASLSTSTLAVGRHPLTASYKGDTCYAASGSDTVVVEVNPSVLAAGDQEPVVAFGLGRISPNPSFGMTRIEYRVAREASIRLSIVDVQGREVAVLSEGLKRPGVYNAIWGAASGRGRVQAGLYFARYQVAGQEFVRRFAVAR